MTNDVAPTLADRFGALLHEWEQWETSATLAFDLMAEAFYRDTGFLAPGKSEPMEMFSEGREQRRTDAYREWTGKRKAERIAILREVHAALQAQSPAAGRGELIDSQPVGASAGTPDPATPSSLEGTLRALIAKWRNEIGRLGSDESDYYDENGVLTSAGVFAECASDLDHLLQSTGEGRGHAHEQELETRVVTLSHGVSTAGFDRRDGQE